MRRMYPILPWLILAAWLAAVSVGWPCAAVAGEPVETIELGPTEKVHLEGGRVYEGLIESEDDTWLHLANIRRARRRAMYVVIRPIEQTSIDRVERLPKPQRNALRRRIDQFIHRARIEAARVDAVQLKQVAVDDRPFFRYRGKWFTLDSAMDEQTTRLLIVRLEQIFTGYRQILPPRVSPARPLRVLVYGSLQDYQDLLARFGVRIGNRACYVPSENLVAVGSELERYAAQLGQIRRQHAQIQAQLQGVGSQIAKQSQQLNQLVRNGAPPQQIAGAKAALAKLQRDLNQVQQQLTAVDRRNERVVEQIFRDMLSRVYHEAFHAYLANYVYPPDEHDVPVWLNEGLALVFESSLLETGSGSLRIDVPNKEASDRLKRELHNGRALPLADLLAAGADRFVVSPDANDETANRYYVHAWGVAYYLTFQTQVLGGAAIDRYVAADVKTAPPVERFERLIDMPLARFDDAWQDYILALQR